MTPRPTAWAAESHKVASNVITRTDRMTRLATMKSGTGNRFHRKDRRPSANQVYTVSCDGRMRRDDEARANEGDSQRYHTRQIASDPDGHSTLFLVHAKSGWTIGHRTLLMCWRGKPI
jgi:hypothetical protein